MQHLLPCQHLMDYVCCLDLRYTVCMTADSDSSRPGSCWSACCRGGRSCRGSCWTPAARPTRWCSKWDPAGPAAEQCTIDWRRWIPAGCSGTEKQTAAGSVRCGVFYFSLAACSPIDLWRNRSCSINLACACLPVLFCGCTSQIAWRLWSV